MLNRTFGCVRLVWNKTLAARHARWHGERKSTSYAETDRALTAMKQTADLAFLAEVRDFLHKTSTGLVRRFDAVAVEDLAVANMLRNRSLARSISRTGWAEFRTLLAYKAHRDGRALVVVDRWYPSSKTCSACGHLLGKLSLSTRAWTCPGCGTRHDRDVNAAQNIKVAAGLVETINACGADVRRVGATPAQPAVKQENQPVREGIHHP